MTITKDQADAAQATIDADTAKLAAVQAELTAYQSSAAALQTEMTADQAEVNRLSSEIAAARAIVDQFASQGPPPPPPGDTGGYTIPAGKSPVSGFTMPTMPDMPQGTLTKRSAMDVTSNHQRIVMRGNHWTNYIGIDHSNKALVVDYLELIDTLVDSEGGTAFYCGSMCGGGEALIDRLAGKMLRPGRPLLRFCGVWSAINIPNLFASWDLSPNTHTGDIATAVQFGNKAAGEHIGHVHLGKVFGGANRDSWPSTKYWNGDGGGTAERTVDQIIVEHLTAVGSPDAGFDTKAKDNQFGLVYSDGNREALKLWNKARAAQVESHNPHVQGGSGGSSHFRLMGFADTAVPPPVYEFPVTWLDGTAAAARIEDGEVELHIDGHYEGPDKAIVLTNGGKLNPKSTWRGSAIPASLVSKA